MARIRSNRRYWQQAKNPAVKPEWATYWCPEKKRWYHRAPEAHKRYKVERRAKRLQRRELRGSGDWKAQLRKLENYRMSPEWGIIKQRIKDRDGHRCIVCGRTDHLEVHHLHYDNVFCEEDEDLVTLCGGKDGCHRGIHYDENGKRRRDWKRFNPPPVNSPSPQSAQTECTLEGTGGQIE